MLKLNKKPGDQKSEAAVFYALAPWTYRWHYHASLMHYWFWLLLELALVLACSLLLYSAADAADMFEHMYVYVAGYSEAQQLAHARDDVFCANRDGNFLGLLQKHYGASKGLGCRDCHAGTALLGPVLLLLIVGWKRRWGRALLRGILSCFRCCAWCGCVCVR